jgi:hypothetical protein
MELKSITFVAPFCFTINWKRNIGIIKLNSMVWIRERTIPTERPPLVGEVIANLCGQRVPRGQRDGTLWPYSLFSRQEPLLFYQVAPQLYSRGCVHPVPDSLHFFFSGSAGNRTRASGSVAKNSDHQTTEVVTYALYRAEYITTKYLNFSSWEDMKCFWYTHTRMNSLL